MFMKPEIVSGTFVSIDDQFGTTVLPMEVVGTTDKEELLNYVNCSTAEDIEDVSVSEGWGVRLSAAGYMDCTEWAVVATEDEALALVDEMYDIAWCEKCGDWHDRSDVETGYCDCEEED